MAIEVSSRFFFRMLVVSSSNSPDIWLVSSGDLGPLTFTFKIGTCPSI
jgi:hypothetical protein